METTLDTIATVAVPSADNFLAVGTLLQGGRYRIERQLASGGFGKTYVATDLAFKRTVVLKEFYLKGTCLRETDDTVTVSLSEHQPFFEAQRNKFRKEARRIFDLDHPNIVKVYDLFDANGTSYYTMSFVNGESLCDRVAENGLIPEKQVWAILKQLLDALEHIHERHIWHLDLKPANVLIDDKGHVTLIDFGASKLINNDSNGSNTTSSAMAYTPGFAPIEQEGKDFKNLGPWTDFYALGATIYSLVVGSPIPTSSEIVVDGDAAFNFTSSVSKNLRNLIIWMMKVNHKQRPQSAEEIWKKKDLISTELESKKSIPNVEETRLLQEEKPLEGSAEKKGFYIKRWTVAVVILLILGVGVWGFMLPNEKTSGDNDAQTEKSIDRGIGTFNDHDYIDLGLPSGTLWAMCNVGASSPEEYGVYFAWGETSTSRSFFWENYFDTKDNGYTFRKYNKESGLAELDPADDPAHKIWGEGWRLPSKKQFEELCQKCTWTWKEWKGVKGYELKSKLNGRKLFLPAAGFYDGNGRSNAGSWGYYWSRSYDSGNSMGTGAFSIYFGTGHLGKVSSSSRYEGCSVRPVRVLSSE